jgi:hypothetical protein
MKAYQGNMLHHLLNEEENMEKLEQIISNGAELILQLNNEPKKNEQIINEDFIKKHIHEPLKLIAEFYPQYINNIEQFLSEFLGKNDLLNLKYPCVFFHHEFNPWNILKEENGNLVILDWEDAMLKGLPLLDLYNYYTICYRILFFGETNGAKERTLEEKKRRVDLLLKNYTGFVEKYCKILNITPKLKDLFFIIFALNSTSFFIEEKRREIEYGKSWLSLLINNASVDCFENYIKKEVLLYESADK